MAAKSIFSYSNELNAAETPEVNSTESVYLSEHAESTFHLQNPVLKSPRTHKQRVQFEPNIYGSLWQLHSFNLEHQTAEWLLFIKLPIKLARNEHF